MELRDRDRAQGRRNIAGRRAVAQLNRGIEPIGIRGRGIVAVNHRVEEIHQELQHLHLHQEVLPEVRIVNMVYQRYVGSRAMRVHSAEWYNVEVLGLTLRAMKKINFSIVEQRQQALQMLNDLNDAAPYSRDVRFPDDSIYVCVSTGDWIRKFQQVRTSLSLRMHDVRPQANNGGAARDVQAPTAAENDALLAFHNGISSINTQISQGEFLFTREIFENSMGVVWANEQQPNV